MSAAPALHLRPIPEDPALAPTCEPIFFVIQRANGSWSPAAKIMAVFHVEQLAEMEAARLKKQHPQQTFGVWALRSEAREVMEPVEIVRVIDAVPETQQ